MNQMVKLGLVLAALCLSFAPAGVATAAGEDAPADQPAATPGKDQPQPAPVEEILPEPPLTWKPAGEVTGPAPSASLPEKPEVPSPMVSYGEFALDVHGKVQALVGMVGEDANLMNGDSLTRDGFRIRRARLGVDGQIARGWEYGLEMDLIDEDGGGNALLDAFIAWRPADLVQVQVGAGKLPYGRSTMVSFAELQFVERSPWTTIERATGQMMLDLDRQVGLSVGGKVSYLRYGAGVYNGSPGFTQGDNNNGLLYLARLGAGVGEMGSSEADLEGGALRWDFALKGYFNQAPAADVTGAGADVGLKWQGLSLYAEGLWAKSTPATRPAGTASVLDEVERFGLSAQVGYLLPFLPCCDGIEIAARFSWLDDNVHVKNEGDLWQLDAALNLYLHGNNIKAALNYVVKREREGAKVSNDALLAMLQVRF